MANSKNKGTEPAAPGSSFPMGLNRNQEAPQAAQETTERAATHEPRPDMPKAPTGLVGMSSRDMVARITLLVQGAFVNGRKHVTAYEAAANAITVLNMHGLHPLVGRYRTEALEWLRGRREFAEGLKEQEDAEAVAGAKHASEEQGS